MSSVRNDHTYNFSLQVDYTDKNRPPKNKIEFQRLPKVVVVSEILVAIRVFDCNPKNGQNCLRGGG